MNEYVISVFKNSATENSILEHLKLTPLPLSFSHLANVCSLTVCLAASTTDVVAPLFVVSAKKLFLKIYWIFLENENFQFCHPLTFAAFLLAAYEYREIPLRICGKADIASGLPLIIFRIEFSKWKLIAATKK